MQGASKLGIADGEKGSLQEAEDALAELEDNYDDPSDLAVTVETDKLDEMGVPIFTTVDPEVPFTDVDMLAQQGDRQRLEDEVVVAAAAITDPSTAAASAAAPAPTAAAASADPSTAIAPAAAPAPTAVAAAAEPSKTTEDTTVEEVGTNHH